MIYLNFFSIIKIFIDLSQWSFNFINKKLLIILLKILIILLNINNKLLIMKDISKF